MDKKKPGFWRGFTWKRLLRNFLLLLPLFLIVDIVFDLSNWQDHFTVKNLIGLLVRALVLSFIFALWHEPGVDDRPQRTAD
jgi:hypothetical protein